MAVGDPWRMRLDCQPTWSSGLSDHFLLCFGPGPRRWRELFDLGDLGGWYAWGHAAKDTGNEVWLVTVLEVPPVDSPRAAVQVSIVADLKSAKARASASGY